jgi:hypothetical protein
VLRPENSPPVDFTVHMEVEENPGFDYPFSEIPKRKEDLFESQLREIDAAIHYQPKAIPPNMTPSILTTPPSNHNQHTILGDITNSENSITVGRKSQGAKKSWKKLARAQGVHEDATLEPIHIKRSSICLEEPNPIEACLKKRCGGIIDSTSAEAVMQPRRAP